MCRSYRQQESLKSSAPVLELTYSSVHVLARLKMADTVMASLQYNNNVGRLVSPKASSWPPPSESPTLVFDDPFWQPQRQQWDDQEIKSRFAQSPEIDLISCSVILSRGWSSFKFKCAEQGFLTMLPTAYPLWTIWIPPEATLGASRLRAETAGTVSINAHICR